MEFTKVVTERFSCKKFDGRKISEKELNVILEAGRLAPTAKNLQPQHIYVADSNEAVAKIDKHTVCRYNAPTVLVVAYKDDNLYKYPGDKYDSGVEDATIIATHMLLAAFNEGVSACYLNRFDPDALKAELGLPEDEHIVCLIDLGYADKGVKPLPPHMSRKPLSETVTRI